MSPQKLDMKVVGFAFLFLLASCNREATPPVSEIPAEVPQPKPYCESQYKLPWAATLGEIGVKQGNQTERTHKPGTWMEFAYDFTIPDEESVLAARGGTVSIIQDKYDNDHFGGEKYKNQANYVIIDHGDGTSALYLHLQKGIPVAEDQVVSQGQEIGKAGKTGMTWGVPHLHFQVQDNNSYYPPKNPDDKPVKCSWFCKSIKVSFADVPGCNPVERESYASQNQEPIQVPVYGPGDEEQPEVGGEVSGESTTETEQPLSPEEIMMQDCLVAPETIADGPMETFVYFRELWREAGVIPQPEPQSFMEMEPRIDGYVPPLDYHYGTDRPPYCTYLEIPVDGGYYLVYRTKAGEVRKIFIGPENLIGRWEGTLESVSERGGGFKYPVESHQFEITHDGCTGADLCLHWLTWPEWLNLPENLSPFGYGEIPPDWLEFTNATFCFGRIDTANREKLLPSDDFAFCFARIDQDTLYLDAFGALWSARGSLHRVEDGAATVSQTAVDQFIGNWKGTVSFPSDTQYGVTHTYEATFILNECGQTLCLSVPLWYVADLPPTSINKNEVCFDVDPILTGIRCFTLRPDGRLFYEDRGGPTGEEGILEKEN